MLLSTFAILKAVASFYYYGKDDCGFRFLPLPMTIVDGNGNGSICFLVHVLSRRLLQKLTKT